MRELGRIDEKNRWPNRGRDSANGGEKRGLGSNSTGNEEERERERGYTGTGNGIGLPVVVVVVGCVTKAITDYRSRTTENGAAKNMAFWNRIKPLKLKTISIRFERCYFEIPRPCLANHICSRTRIFVLDNPNSVIHKSHIEFSNSVRFFAAPIQAKPKQEEKDTSGPRLNEKITAEFVRLVSDEGHNVVSRREALECARIRNLDLVEVQRNAKPPVCKLMDYHKEKYNQQVKEKDRAKSKSEVTLRKGDCKEVRFSGKTEQKDLQMKANTVKRLMERGYRVKCMAMGTEEQDLGGLLSRLSALIEDVSIIESGPRVEKKQAYAIVRHIKFGPSKKGSGKKASKVVDATSPEVQKVATLNQSPVHSKDITESGSETEDESFFEEVDMPIALNMTKPDNDIDKKNPTWSVVDANDDFDSAFGIIRGDATIAKSSRDVQMKIDSTETVPSSLSEGLPGMENRYRREPRNTYPPTKPRDSMRSVPQLPNQHRLQQFGLNASPSRRETERVETDGSLFGNVKVPANDIPKQEQFRLRSPGSPVPSFGIFSAPKVNDTSEKNGVPAAVNRYQKGNSFDSTRQPRPRGVSANPNSPLSNSSGSGRSGIDNGGQGKWGIFSGESSNVMTSRIHDSQAKAQ
ncbi:hypothetical protein HYC85_009461 [Camellia sinensis]|uniref:Translation initiation factor 3 N-terminal domain-containing protein n=1 Tax=Camellia sinensis TaxID=4442 RepID=A0A7J7HGB0_CAMSI|nr:hypothetical protein HYC85_009461 [Camellia sinensis]